MTTEANDEDVSPKEKLYFNGVNGTTGRYLTSPMTNEELSRYIAGETFPPNFDVLQERVRQKEEGYFAPVHGVNAKELGQAGWGVIYAPSISDAVKEALQPLIRFRQEQAGDLFKTYQYNAMSSLDFLIEHEVGLGPAEPSEMPYYLLLVGSPEEIPFAFQYELDVQRAVGRIYFDTPEEYDNYAHSVVAAEKGEVRLLRRASFFGAANPNDLATQLSADLLIEPLYQELKTELAAREVNWEVNSYLREVATKAQLGRLLGGSAAETPAFLLTASHGVGFDPDDPRQLAHQGALLCQDWAGRPGRLEEDVYFAGEHLASDARLHGLISFFFACYGAGTPSHDEFSRKIEGQPKQIAPQSFLASLPRRMLSHPRGGALAVIGHIERAWTYSFKWSGKPKAQRAVFDATLGRLFDGYPVGYAFDYFNERHAEASVQLAALFKKQRQKELVSPVQLTRLWTINNDARDYIILGDPAVRLCVPETAEEMIKSSMIELKSVDLTSYRPGLIAANQPPVAVDSATGIINSVEAGLTATLDQEAESMAIDVVEAGKLVAASLKEASRKLAGLIERTTTNLSTLEVLTYLSDDELENVYDQANKRFRAQAKLKAVTLISLDGDVQSMVPARQVEILTEDNKLTLTVEIDEKLLQIHRDMVNLAQANRTVFLKNLAEIAATLVNTRL